MSHDMTKPYTEEELEGVKAIFRSMPSYVERVSSTDTALLIKRLGWPRSPAQTQAYIDYWNKFFDGVIPLPFLLQICRHLHDSLQLMREAVKECDKDGNGYISKDEFGLLLSYLVIHDPNVKSTPFDQFVKEADTNKDGLVSIDECVAWVEKLMKK